MKTHLRFQYRPFSVLILVLLLVSMLFTAGCVQETPTAAEPEKFTPTPEPDPVEDVTATPRLVFTPTPTYEPGLTVQPEDLAEVAIRFLHPWTGEAAETLEEIATQFSLSNPWNIWVDVESTGGETALLDTLLANAEDNDLPEIIAVHPYQLETLDNVYEIVPLTEYLGDPQWGLDDASQKDIPPVFLEPFIHKEELLALPVAPQATLMFINQTWADELGFGLLPGNDIDFRQQSCQAAFANREDLNDENDGTGGWLVNLEPEILAAWFQAFGGELPVSGIPQFNSDAGREAFGYLKSVYDQGCFWVGRKPDPYFYFANRYALAYTGTLDQIPAQMAWMDVAESQDNWTVMGFPGPAGEVILVDGPGLVIKADTPEVQLAAWLFARHLVTPEVQNKLVRALLTLPVRRSALELLEDLAEDFPQWAQGVALMDKAVSLPVSVEWGYSQWLLQDAITRLLQMETLSPAQVLNDLDRMIVDLEGTTP